jgi:hypothetical protein
MNDEIVSCMAIGDRPYLVAATKDGRVFIGYVRTGDGPDVEWTRCTDIPLRAPSTE